MSAGKALRWRWLYPQAAPPVAGLAHFSILMIAQMLNVVVPVRLGEVARLGLMQQEGRPVGMTLGTIVVEKSLGLADRGDAPVSGRPDRSVARLAASESRVGCAPDRPGLDDLFTARPPAARLAPACADRHAGAGCARLVARMRLPGAPGAAQSWTGSWG